MSSLEGDKARLGTGYVPVIRSMFSLFRSALREIFDETAYERFLQGRDAPSSKAAYAEFLREGQAARERRPRCC